GRGGKPVILIANKAEGRQAMGQLDEAYALGLGDPVAISAQHGEGLGDLYERLQPYIAEADEEVSPLEPAGERPLQLAIVGRPNVGKSTLVNRLLGKERMLTGPEPGITRDAIAIDWRWRDRPIRLVDTAGLRRRSRVEDRVERLSTADTRRTIGFAGTLIPVLDALQPLERQDLTIANIVAEEGRALALALNKWDAVPDRDATLKRVRERLETALPQLQGIALVPISGLNGTGLEKLMEAVFAADAVWNRRGPTPPPHPPLPPVPGRPPPPPPPARPAPPRPPYRPH